MTVTMYTFEDADGGEHTYTTFNPREAEGYAREHGLKCRANEFTYSDSEIAWDFTYRGEDQEDAE